MCGTFSVAFALSTRSEELPTQPLLVQDTSFNFSFITYYVETVNTRKLEKMKIKQVKEPSPGTNTEQALYKGSVEVKSIVQTDTECCINEPEDCCTLAPCCFHLQGMLGSIS